MSTPKPPKRPVVVDLLLAVAAFVVIVLFLSTAVALA